MRRASSRPASERLRWTVHPPGPSESETFGTVAAWRMITTWPPLLRRPQIASSAVADAGAERRRGQDERGRAHSRRDGAHLDASVVGGLAARNAGVEAIAGLGAEARLAARQGIEPRPSIAGPHHAGRMSSVTRATASKRPRSLASSTRPPAAIREGPRPPDESTAPRVARPREHGQGATIVRRRNEKR